MAKWFDFKRDNFDIYGISTEDYSRLPLEFAKSISEGVTNMSRAPSGGRIRFSTNSSKIYIKAVCDGNWNVPFDLYKFENGADIFAGCFRSWNCFIRDGEYTSGVELNNTQMQSYTINFPFVGKIFDFKLGIDDGAILEKGEKYINEKPVLFYGSSITQGAWASRAGMTYENLLSQRYNMDYLNMGFAGAAKGETALIEYLADMDICAFVSDYDHNAYEEGLLKATHINVYKTVRAKHPNIPYVIITRPDYWPAPAFNDKRTAIILETFDYAKSIGDENVYFVDGKTFFNGEYSRNCTMDGCHPNDVGFSRMAEVLAPVFAKVLNVPERKHDFKIY